MQILVSLPTVHPEIADLDDVVLGRCGSSGTIDAIVRSAKYLSNLGHRITISGTSATVATFASCTLHEDAEPGKYDLIIAHQSHWKHGEFTFGGEHLKKSILYLHNPTSWGFVDSYLKSGGKKVLTCSAQFSERYRAVGGWESKISFVHNPYCSIFNPDLDSPQANTLLFVGAITPTKGFNELMEIWSRLVEQGADLKLDIAGSIGVHKKVKTGPLGVGEEEYEMKKILPWLETLPVERKPQFLGAVSRIELRRRMNEAWGVIVNPSWTSAETFCVSAVEAQACNKTVFSAMAGGLKETVYRGSLQTLATDRSPAAIADLILGALSNPGALKENNVKAGEFVRKTFSDDAIRKRWAQVVEPNAKTARFRAASYEPASRGLFMDALRATGTGILFERHLLRRR